MRTKNDGISTAICQLACQQYFYIGEISHRRSLPIAFLTRAVLWWMHFENLCS